jgi:protocatechuate 3,4-dioxygenase beta subunit
MAEHRQSDPGISSRRTFLGVAGAALSLAGTPLGAIPGLQRTPRQSLGPFYPASLPLDSDSDLVQVEGRTGRARGVVTHIAGRVMDDRGRAVPEALVEIWQCNAFGRYHHPRDRRDAPIDENFQGYGRSTTRDGGAYRFRTIRPVPYPGRAPHIHFVVRAPGAEPLVTQMYVAGEPGNTRDGLLNGILDPRARESLIVDLRPLAGSVGELTGVFDVILAADGRTARAEPRLLEALRRGV